MSLTARRLLGAVKRRLLGRDPTPFPEPPPLAEPTPDPVPEPTPVPAPEPTRKPEPRPTPLRPALVIPVHNDADGLSRLLDQVHTLDCFAQIIVVDDGSTPAVSLPGHPEVILLRHEQAKGGGVARNLGLTAVTAPHVLFFDADDFLTDALPALLTTLGGAGPFDFCQFKYADSRVQAEALRGHPDWDEAFWEQAGLSVGHLRDAQPEVWPLLAQTANYPWNKVYRTEFLRDHSIGCADTQVHQDIPLHWLGYLAATRILTSDRICAWHHVSAAGGRLTNRSGPERLEVFAALAPVMQAADTANTQWQQALAAFALGLIDWASARISPDLRTELRSKEQTFLAAHVGAWMPGIEAADPELARRLRQRMEPIP